jgi:diguanylate cyclase (GGDEF)-like protein/PAS domain S-box-containing protein
VTIHGFAGLESIVALVALCVLGGLVCVILRLRVSRIEKAEAALREREQRIALALNGSNDGLWHWNLVTDATYYSPRLNELLEYGMDEIKGTIFAFLELVHPDDRSRVRQALDEHRGDRRPFETELRLRLKSGEHRWFRARGREEFDATGRAMSMAGSMTDITDRKLAEAASSRHAMQQGLIAELGQFALKNPPLNELASHAIAVVTRGLAAEFCRLLVAEADDKSLMLMGAEGWEPDWIAKRHYDAAEETEDRFIIGVREAVLVEDFTTESRFKASPVLTAHGIRAGAEMLICGAQNSYGMLGIYSRRAGQFTWENITFLRGITNILASSMDRSIADERLTYLAQFDALTGLPNRSMFLERLWHTIADGDHGKRQAGVIFVDLDRFKLVNDTLGHGAGDGLLLQVALRLLSCVRCEDIVGRLGGDEFAIALAGIEDAADAGAISQGILSALAEPFELAGREIYISASLGIGIYPSNGMDPVTLLKNADTAMYRAKESGRNTFEFYVPQMNERAVERLRIETELRGALERGEFLLHYQPKADIASQEISGFEALLRWQHPERGLVAPGEFISILEETGLIIPVGEWVIRTVCHQLNAWKAANLPLRPVAINLSARQFMHANLDAIVGEILLATGVAAHLLEFELTESILMTDSEASVRILKNLKNFGIRLSVDDFGTGYSSLAYLRRFPLDALKIDRAFIRDVCTDADGAAIVLAIINLAHCLKLYVVAEGVETDAQYHFLRRHGCDELQGYYFSRPKTADDCTRALIEGLALGEPHAVHLLVRQA